LLKLGPDDYHQTNSVTSFLHERKLVFTNILHIKKYHYDETSKYQRIIDKRRDSECFEDDQYMTKIREQEYK